ncbi:hypothetical protein CNEO4_130002 [Clostridium neonatale]|nr:hypothetical protein CNEO4_130002 [Clostridium neonatale]
MPAQQTYLANKKSHSTTFNNANQISKPYWVGVHDYHIYKILIFTLHFTLRVYFT